MIFSDRIFKIINGKNISLYADDIDVLNLYIHNKNTKLYKILLNSNKNCVFSKEYNYSKIIQLNSNTLSIASNGYITLVNEKDI